METAPDSVRMRMHGAFKQFFRCLSDFASWGYIGEDKKVALRWDSAMKLIQQALDAWWEPWATITPGQGSDALPNDVNVGQLECILQDVAQRVLSLKPESVQPGESSVVLGEGGLLARRQQSEESPLPATVSYLHDKSWE